MLDSSTCHAGLALGARRLANNMTFYMLVTV